MFMGMSYATKEDWEKTEECCKLQVIRIFEENGDSGSILLIDTYTTKANAVAKMGRYKEAHQLCKKAKRNQSDEGLIFLTEGKVYLEEDIEKKATQAFKSCKNQYRSGNVVHDRYCLFGTQLYVRGQRKL